MLKVGLTGGIAAGKSTVGRMFGELGCRVIDSDLITRKLFAAGDPVNQAVAATFGPSVVAFDGSIDRRVLGELVFKNPELRQQLNNLVHPAINQRQADWLAKIAAEDPHSIGIADIAKPDYGDAVPIEADEIPVFWACGVTPQAVISAAKVPFAITHAPGQMLVTDLKNKQLAVL